MKILDPVWEGSLKVAVHFAKPLGPLVLVKLSELVLVETLLQVIAV